ncbi:MAG: hypothetical protein ACYSUI_02975 [Planctomycetota bacterium]|jgi:hypothetical protein
MGEVYEAEQEKPVRRKVALTESLGRLEMAVIITPNHLQQEEVA